MGHGLPKLRTIADEAQHHFMSDHCTATSATSSMNSMDCSIAKGATSSSIKCINGFVERFVLIDSQYLVVSLTFGVNWDHNKLHRFSLLTFGNWNFTGIDYDVNFYPSELSQ
jgi:hypothetical protein